MSQATAVNAVAISGANVYVGGSFGSLTFETPGIVANYIARWNGRGWSSLGSGAQNGVDAQVAAIAVSGPNVYVGGSFTHAGGILVNHVARWNGSAWSALGSGMANVPGSFAGLTVYTLAVSGTTLYAGGIFDLAGGVTVHSIAAWNGTSWSAVDGGVLSCLGCAPPQSGTVKALLVAGGRLYMGGQWDEAGSTLTTSIAQLIAGHWVSVGGTGAHAPNGQDGAVYALAMSPSGSLYASGYFDHMDTVAAQSIAQYTNTGWHSLGTGIINGTNPGSVYGLGFLGTRLLAGGSFTDAGGDGQPNVAQWNGVNWTGVGTGLDGPVTAIAASAAGPIAVGDFIGSNGSPLNHVATWTGSGWGAFGLGVAASNHGDGYLNAVAAAGHTLYAAGHIQNAGGTLLFDRATSMPTNIARFSGGVWDDMRGGLNGVPLAITLNGSQVFVGGGFSQAGSGAAGVAASNIAMWDGSGWHALGSGVDGLVRTLMVYGGKLWVGGSFTHAGAVAANHVATYNLTTHVWAAVGNNPVFASRDSRYPSDVLALAGLLAPNGHYVFIGGNYDLLRGATGDAYVNGLVFFDTTAPIDPANPFSGYYITNDGPGPWDTGVSSICSGSPCPGSVHTLMADSTNVYVGGDFGTAGTTASRSFARFTVFAAPTHHWSSLGGLGGTADGAPGPVANAITKVGATIYVAGDFTAAGNVLANSIAGYTPGRGWGSLASGIPGGITSLTQSSDGLYAGGLFGVAGQHPSSNLALWGATATAADLSVTQKAPASATVNSAVTFTSTVANQTAFASTAATLTATLPAGTTFISATPSQGTCTMTAGKVTCSLGVIAAHTTPTVAIVVRSSRIGQITNTVVVAPADGSADNSAATSVAITA